MMVCVTTFPAAAWDVYGKPFLTSYLKAWPVPIIVYHDPGTLPALVDDKVVYRPLDSVDGFSDFMSSESPEPPPHGPGHAYLYMAKRFAHKVYAWLGMFENPVARYVIWLDADIECIENVTEGWIRSLFEGNCLVYLGRTPGHSECGFVGFDTKHSDFSTFHTRLRYMYNTRHIYSLRGWTDCHAFDACRQSITGTNLTPHGTGVQHVWESSPLQDVMIHNKGPARKQLAYGEAL